MLVSATDVATIARVHRPVVSMWRKRYSGPEAFPVAVDGRFEAEAVVGWLAEHGRGNNPHPERALPMLGMLVEARTDQSRAMGLSAVLACRAAYGEGLVEDLGSGAVTASGVAGLDRFGCFADEVVSLGGDLPRTAAAVDAFLDERFGAPDAMRWFTDDCLVRHLPQFAAAALSDEAAGLVARTAEALAELSPSPGILDAAGTGFSWLQRLAPEWASPVGIRVDESAVGRHTRRVLQVGEWDAQVARDERGWAVAVDVAPDAEAEIFARAALADDAQVRLVLGPARLLADPSGDVAARDELLRDGVVRAVVKLPAGCRPAHPREALALWLVAERDRLPFEQHRTFVADLTGASLTAGLVSDLVLDLAVAAQDPAAQQHRSWRVLRPVLTRHLLARGGSLVATGGAPGGRNRPGVAPEELRAAAARSGIVDLPAMHAGPGLGPREVTAQTGIAEGWLKLLPGSRLPLVELGDGDLTAWTVADGVPSRSVGVDRMTALARKRTWLTSPGDVILAPGPTVVLDTDGGSLVAAPARAMRLTAGAPVTPQQLARAVTSAPRGTKPPQWRLTSLDPTQRAALSAAADRIGQRRAELTAQLDALNSFEGALLDACETATITLETR